MIGSNARLGDPADPCLQRRPAEILRIEDGGKADLVLMFAEDNIARTNIDEDFPGQIAAMLLDSGDLPRCEIVPVFVARQAGLLAIIIFAVFLVTGAIPDHPRERACPFDRALHGSRTFM